MPFVLSNVRVDKVDDIRTNGSPENSGQFQSDAGWLTFLIVDRDQGTKRG